MVGPGPRWRIDDVLAGTDLASLLDEVGQPGAVQTRGRRWHCPLPDHDDSHPSVTMHTDHRGHERWRCWSGDDRHRGDAIDLAAATQHLSRSEAIDWLAQRAGLHPDQPLPPARKVTPPRPANVPLDPKVLQYAGACERILWGPAGAPVRDWLHGRGFPDEVLHANHVGVDPGRSRMPRARGLPYGHSIGAVFPALDPDGAIRYLQTRYLDPGDGPKYDNPASTLGTNPRLAWTQGHPDDAPAVLIVCEGIPDALTAAVAGFRSVATLGAQAPDRNVAVRIAGIARQLDLAVIQIADGDPAGTSWSTRLRDLLAEEALAVTELAAPQGLDLSSWSQQSPHWPNLVEHELESRGTRPTCETDALERPVAIELT